MSLSGKIALASCCLALVLRADEPTLRTAAELRTLPESSARSGRSFDLTAQVIHAFPNSRAFIVSDGSGGVSLTVSDAIPAASIQIGDVVRWLGSAAFGSNHLLKSTCQAVTNLGNRALPPVPLTDPQQIAEGHCNYSRVKVTGLVTAVFRDEIDPHYCYLVLRTGEHSLYAAIALPQPSDYDCARLETAEVELVGTCSPDAGNRLFLGPTIHLASTNDIRIVRPAPSDAFSVPHIEDLYRGRASDITRLGRRKIDGVVTATWARNNLMLQTDSGTNLRIELSDDRLPACGVHIEAVGQLGTDLYHLNLSRARWRPLPPAAATSDITPTEITAQELMSNPRGERKFKPQHQGRLFNLTGVIRSLSPASDPLARMMLMCDDYLIPVDASSCPEALSALELDSTVAVTGVCVLDVPDWNPNAVFPRIEGLMLVVRSAADIAVLARPPWWTPARLLAVIGSLLAVLIGILVWNRILNRLVERRSRQLLREQAARVGETLKVGERTRLAVELHDSLSQTLTGVSFQIDAAEQARQKDPSQVKHYLDVARQTLKSCREELRNCLWDLRNNALEEEDAEVAIRRTVEPQIGDAELSIDFKVPRQRLTDNTFHAILSIVRELAVNGVRHGGATHIAIDGRTDGDRLVFSVKDDGCGFDPDNRPGSDEGHFGLLGVTERVEALDGTMEIASGAGSGTRTAISFAL